MTRKFCTYPNCKCIVSTSTSQPIPDCPHGFLVLKQTSAKPITIDGITFRCYRTGILRYSWFSDCGRIAIGRHVSASAAYRKSAAETFSASINGVNLATRFRSQKNAMKKAVELLPYVSPDDAALDAQTRAMMWRDRRKEDLSAKRKGA